MKSKTPTITKPGQYLTREGKVAVIVALESTRAHGSVPGNIERTWWYADSGEHALWPLDDIIKRVTKHTTT